MRRLLFAFFLLLMGWTFSRWGGWMSLSRAMLAQTQAPAAPLGEAFTALVSLGWGDSAERDWSGELSAHDAQVTALEGWKFFGTDEALSPTAWNYRSGREQPRARITGEALHWVDYPPGLPEAGGILIHGRGGPGAALELRTRQGAFSFALSELSWRAPLEKMGGAVRVARLPGHTRLSRAMRENDFVDIATAPDGNAWVVWTSYAGGRDEIRLAQFVNDVWNTDSPVPGVSGDVWRPRVGVEGDGTVWVVWSQQVRGNWDLYAAAMQGNAWIGPVRLTSDPGADFNARLARGPDGRLWVAWQGVRNGVSNIFLNWRGSQGNGWSADVRLTQTAANNWNPAIGVDSSRRAYVVYDTYRNGNYDVFLRGYHTETGLGPETTVADSPHYEAYPEIAVDRQDRLWLLWEQGAVNWGKDRGYTLPKFGPGQPPGADTTLRLAVLARGQSRFQAPAASPMTALAERDRRFVRYPALAVDGAGRPWVAFRRLNQAGLAPGIGNRYYWAAYATAYEGDRWLPAALLPESPGRISSFPVVAGAERGAWLAWSGDSRRYGAASRPGANHVFAGRIALDSTPSAGPKLVDWQPAAVAPVPPVHPNEAEDVRALRDYRLLLGGRTYRVVRGDLHRHSELSQDLGGSADGSLLDFYRYMLDAAAMDFGAITDHQMGGGNDYWYWYTQKTTDLFHWTPAFTALFGYERSVSYPHGHRNVFHARRGVPVVDFFTRPSFGGLRPPVSGASEVLLHNDTKLLYAALRESGGIAISHTSATRMGTDWRDNDPLVEPVVEIFQGCRNSYEAAGAPKSPDPDRDRENLAPPHMGYYPLGFVSNAWNKGYRLGVITSSDHSSVHYSYAMVFTESTDRAGIIEAIRKRHTYAATDNILLEVRAGEHMMGDEFVWKGPLRLQVRARGTVPIARVTVIRNNQAVFTRGFNAREASFVYQDQEPPGASQRDVNSYYVRVEQQDGQLAWSSPLWIRRGK